MCYARMIDSSKNKNAKFIKREQIEPCAQDVFLTGTPKITFWKISYRRHTNFAMEPIEQTFSEQADFGRRS